MRQAIMVIVSNDSSQTNLFRKSLISICITVLFAQSISIFSPIHSAFPVEIQEEDQNDNYNKGYTTLVVTTIQSPSSSANNHTNLSTGNLTVTKMPSEKVLIGNEESKEPFKPSQINITDGNTIMWINSDVETHTVTSGSPDNKITNGKEFDSGNLNPNQIFEHTFDKAGIYKYFCILHPSMTGLVNVR